MKSQRSRKKITIENENCSANLKQNRALRLKAAPCWLNDGDKLKFKIVIGRYETKFRSVCNVRLRMRTQHN